MRGLRWCLQPALCEANVDCWHRLDGDGDGEYVVILTHAGTHYRTGDPLRTTCPAPHTGTHWDTGTDTGWNHQLHRDRLC